MGALPFGGLPPLLSGASETIIEEPRARKNIRVRRLRARRFSIRRAARRVPLPQFFLYLFLLAVVSLMVAEAQSLAGAPALPPRAYPDFALHAAPINTSPGPEYGSSTSVHQGVPGLDRTGRTVVAIGTGGATPLNYLLVVTSGDDDGPRKLAPRLAKSKLPVTARPSKAEKRLKNAFPGQARKRLSGIPLKVGGSRGGES